MLWRRSGALSPDVECPGKKSAHRTARQIIEKNRFRLMRKTPCGRASPVRSFRRGGKAKAQKAICIPRVDRHPESRGGPAFPRARRRAGDEPGTGTSSLQCLPSTSTDQHQSQIIDENGGALPRGRRRAAIVRTGGIRRGLAVPPQGGVRLAPVAPALHNPPRRRRSGATALRGRNRPWKRKYRSRKATKENIPG